MDLIAKQQEIIEIQRNALRVADYCLSDYVTTEHGVKIVNEKDLEDPQSILKEALEKTRQLSGE